MLIYLNNVRIYHKNVRIKKESTTKSLNARQGPFYFFMYSSIFLAVLNTEY